MGSRLKDRRSLSRSNWQGAIGKFLLDKAKVNDTHSMPLLLACAIVKIYAVGVFYSFIILKYRVVT